MNKHVYIERNLEKDIETYMKIFPVVAILGPRQCGKSTLIKHFVLNSVKNAIYLDLQNNEDLNKLQDPRLFFKANIEKTLCIDEIQLVPDLFTTLRSVIDEERRNGKFILLGSASRELIQKSSETLAGRIGYLSLTPFLINELIEINMFTFWNRGGFPESILAENDLYSYIWRENFIKTYIERDLPQLGFQIPPIQLIRFLTICAHEHGQTLNLSKLSSAMGMTHPTMKKYFDLFEQTFVTRSLKPYELNIKKRLIKSPKIYIRDTGILHHLLGIKNTDMLFSNPIFGASWEGLVIEQVLSQINAPAYFYRTSNGEEVDLLIQLNNLLIAIECKASSAPKLSKGFYNVIEDLKPNMVFIASPIESASYQLSEKITVIGLKELITTLLKIASN
ncbi:MAG: ATP-binding protein [Bacteroidia bacterium]